MNARHPILARLLTMLGGALMAIAFTACGGSGYGGGGGGGGGGNVCGGVYVACPPPTVSITTPANGDSLSGTVMIIASATASATYNLTIASVQVFVDGNSVGTATTAPYTVSWNSTTVAKGSHTLTAKATDSMNDTATSAGVMITTTGMAATAMSAKQVFPMTASSASGVAHVAIEHETGAVTGSVSLSGLEARSVTLHEGFAGTSGAAVLALTPRAGSAGVWDVPAGARLTPQQVSAFGQGRLYVLAASAAFPNGEIRGQLGPDSIRVTFTPLSATSEAAAAFGSNLSAVAATTVDTAARTATVHVSSLGLEQTTAAAVSSGAKQLAPLTRDAVEPGHWSSELARISAADIESFEAGRWGVSVAAAAAPRGAMVGLIEPRD